MCVCVCASDKEVHPQTAIEAKVKLCCFFLCKENQDNMAKTKQTSQTLSRTLVDLL